MAGACSAFLVAAAVSVAAVLAAGAPEAHATAPATACGFECKWPVGAYSIPERIEDGGEFEISWSYSWDPQNPLAAAAEARGAPDGHYAAPGGAADVAPPGYAGSAVRLRLPQELEIVGWEDAGLVRERLWTDHYGRTMYEYTGTNVHAESGRHDMSIAVRLADDGMFYPVTELAVDLGLSVSDSPPRALYAVRDAMGASLSVEPPGATVSGASDEYPHRQSLRWPLPEVESAAMPAGAVGAAGNGETYVHGYLQYMDREGAARAAGGVRACVYDVGATAGDLTPLREGGACAQTGADGFYGIAVPRADPNGDGDADILVRFTTEDAAVTTRNGPAGPAYLYDQRGSEGPLGAALSMGRVTVPATAPFSDALGVHVPVWGAWKYFVDTFAHDVPHVTINSDTANEFYVPLTRAIHVNPDPDRRGSYGEWIALHEYGHHILHTLVSGLPVDDVCEIHHFRFRTSDLCAFDEGWASFVTAMVRGDPVISTGPGEAWDLERAGAPRGALQSPPLRGSDVEGTVMAILWDIYDGRGPQEAADDVGPGAQLLWDTLRDEPERGEQYPALSIRDFADDWEDSGYPGLDGLLEHNGVHAHGGATMQVLLGSGAARAGDAATLATSGQAVRVSARAQDGGRPSISFYGGAPAPMAPIGGGWWAGEHAVTSATPDGPVRFVVSSGGDTTHTLHDVEPASRVTVDRTPPAAPSAEFVAPGTIVLTFQERLAPFGAGAFGVAPPGGSSPSVSASRAGADFWAQGDGREAVVLSLDPAASAEGQWRVAIPASITDMAGNAYVGGFVTAGFEADSEPPTFSAKRVGLRHIAVEFGEDVRPVERLEYLDLHDHFDLEVAPGTLSYPDFAYADWPNGRITLEFDEVVPAGTLTFADLHGGGVIEDALGNGLVDYTDATVAAGIVPDFRVLRYDASPAHVEVVWDVPVAGTTSVSEWSVNGVRPSGLGARPGVETVQLGGTRLGLFVDGLACPTGTLQVEYMRPSGPGASSLVAAGGVAVASMGASAECARINSQGARFLDDRTVSIELDRPVGGFFQGRFAVEGLGETIEFVEPGSRTVIMHTSSPAAAGTTYTVSAGLQGLGDAFISEDILEPATYMDTTPPTVRRAEIAAAGSSQARVAIYLSEPLDASTLAGKAFTSSTLGEVTASYVAHERALVIGHGGSVGGGPHAVSIPAGIRDVNGQALEAQSVTAATRAEATFGAPRFADGRTVTLESGARLSAETLGGITIEPGLGPVEATQEGRTVTLSATTHARHGTEYTVRLPLAPTDADGRSLTEPRLAVTYADATAPSVTGARLVSPRAIVASLSEPLDETTLAGAAFVVEPTLGALEAEYAAGATSITVRASEEARHGVPYTLVAPGAARDPSGRPLSTLRVPVTGPGAHLVGAAFTSPSTIALEASAPLDASTLAGIEVTGLGRTVASYDPASRTVEVRTTRAAADGATHRVIVPASVLDASGAPVGPLALEATHDAAAGGPRIMGASTAAAGHVRILLDRAVAPAGGSPGSLDASLWAVTPAGREATTPTRAVAVGSDVWLLHAAAPAGAALAVSYTPGGGDGDVADHRTRQGRLVAAALPVEDLVPPTFSARTHSPTATVVTLDKAATGSTSASEWTVEGAEVTGVSALAGGAAPASGASTATLGQGTARIALHHSRIGAGAIPTVSYSPAASGEILAGGAMGAGSVVAADGIAPSVVAAAFGGPRTLHVELDERPGAGAASTGAFTVAGPGGAVGVDGATAAPHSATITLTLSANAAAGAHTVTAGGAVVDLAGNAVAAGARAATASWAAAGGAAPFSARTSSMTSTVVTFAPAASGSTSAASWAVSGAVATGIARVGGAEVADPGAASVALPGGTTSIVLTHARLHGTAAEPIVGHAGAGIAQGDSVLGSLAVKASDGAAPRLVSAVVFGSDEHALSKDTLVRLSEPVTFVEGSTGERNFHWVVTGAMSVQENPVGVLAHSAGADHVLLRGVDAFGDPLSYGAEGGEAGSVVDASGNGLARFSGFLLGDATPPGLDPPIGEGDLVNFGEPVTFPHGEIPVFVFVGEDGVRTGTHRAGPVTTLDVDIEPPMIEGHRYTMLAPGLVDGHGNAYVGGSRTWVFGTGIRESDPPTAESARFSGPREVHVAFSEPLAAVPAGAAFSVTPAGEAGNLLAAGGVSHSVGLRTVTLLLSAAASPGAHEVRVPSTVTDLAGNAYGTPSAAIPATYDAVAPAAVSAAFTGGQTVALTVSEALDAATVGGIRVRGLGATSASYTTGSTTVGLHTQLAAAPGSSHAVEVPAGVTDVAGVAMQPTVLWAARADTAAPTAIGARTVSPTATEVDFGEAVRIGASPTAEQHAAHWTVAEGSSARAVTGAEVVRGGLSVRLTHAPVGASAAPSVSYSAGAAHDDASVRDWAATPNYLATTDMGVAAKDGLPPSIDSLTMFVSREGEADGTPRLWARAGDTVRFAMSMSEAAGASAPVIRVAGAAHNMAPSGGDRMAWTHSHTVPAMGAAQGALAFVVSASDGGGNAAHAVAPTSGATAMVDTILPSFTAHTLGAGLVGVTLSEPVHGTIAASEWTVGGIAATGVAPSAGSAPRASAALDAGASFVLWHGGAGTDGTPEVRYSPPGTP